MSGRRALAGSLLALLMPASMLMVTQTSSSSADTADSISTSASERRAKKTRVKLVALPQIVGQGKRPASAGSAKAGLTATVKPAKAGRPVALQVKKGSKWKTVKKTKLNKKGRAEFGAPISKGGQALTYRATGDAVQGLQGRHEQVGQHLALDDPHRGPTSSPAARWTPSGTTAAATTSPPACAPAPRVTRAPSPSAAAPPA